MVSAQSRDTKNLPHLQDHVLEHAKEPWQEGEPMRVLLYIFGFFFLIFLRFLFAGWVVKTNFNCAAFFYDMAYDSDRVMIEPKPHDREWDAAPLGNKFCHYEKVLKVGETPNVKPGDFSHGPPIWVGWRKVQD